jgi:hypothetical protein
MVTEALVAFVGSVLPIPTAPPPPLASSGGIVKGLVVEARGLTPLSGVLVVVQDSGQKTTTNERGGFEIPEVPAGIHTLVVSTVGFGLLRRPIAVTDSETTEIEIRLVEGPGTYSEEVTVRAGPFRDAESGVASQAVLGGLDLMALRGVLADDPLRAVQALPGVATGDDFRAEFAVRGHGPSHIGVSLDGVESPLLLHSVRGVQDTGSLALVNSDILDSATLLAGTYPERLAPRLGARLDFETRGGRRDRLAVRGLASGTAASTVWEGPLGEGRKASWMVAARQSYLDWLLRAVDPDAQSVFGFTDAHLKLDIEPSARHSLKLSFIGGRSLLREREDEPGPNALDRGANRTLVGNLRWRLTLSPAVVMSHQVYLVGARYTNRIADGRIREEGSDRDLTWRGRLEWARGARHFLEVGGDVQALRAARVERRFTSSTERTLNDAEVSTSSAGLWMHYRFTPRPAITLAPGARIDRMNLAGATSLSPWMLVDWKIDQETRLRLGAGLKHQPPTMDQVLLARPDSRLELERAWTLDAGVERSLGPALRARVTAWYRREDDRLRLEGAEPRVAGGIVVRSNASWRNALRGDASGLELTLEGRRVEGFSGWLSYGFGRAELTDATRDETFPSDYDQRHTLNAYVLYRWSGRTSLAARFRLGSNFPLAGYYDRIGENYYLGTAKNEVRLPVYARLDLRADRVFTFRNRRLTVFAEVLNVLNRRNLGPSDPSFNLATGRVRGAVEELFPILPSAGLLVEF